MSGDSTQEVFQLTPELKEMGEDFINALYNHFSPNYALNDDIKIEEFHFKMVLLATIAFARTKSFSIRGLMFFISNVINSMLSSITEEIDLHTKFDVVEAITHALKKSFFTQEEIDSPEANLIIASKIALMSIGEDESIH